MRNLDGGAAVTETVSGAWRLRVWSKTGEEIYHDLTEVEADAIRKALPPPATATAPASSSRNKPGKEK